MQYQEDMGDLLGAESCIDFGPDIIVTGGSGAKLPPRKRRSNAVKEYPPVIPSLTSRTTKYSTEDGRVIIKEEKEGRRLQYMQAHRADGRLLLNLVTIAPENVDDVAMASEKGDTYGGGGFAAAVAVLRPPVFTGETF